VFSGTGPSVVNDVAGGVVLHFGIAAVFGLGVLAMIYAPGDVSGARLNPAAIVVARRFAGRDVAPCTSRNSSAHDSRAARRERCFRSTQGSGRRRRATRRYSRS
jgi:Major intrinsic protein